MRLLPILLIFQMLYLTGVKTFLVLDWKINQDIITEKYCVNKDKLMLDCNGQCYVTKQLSNLEFYESEERKQHPSPYQKFENTKFEWICETDFFVIENFYFTVLTKQDSYFFRATLEGNSKDFFHPPIV